MPASSGVVFVEPANGGESLTKKSSRSLTSFFSGKFSWMSRKDDSTQPRLTGKNSSWEATKAIQHEEDEPSHLFDSPLQMSLHLLDGLQERLLDQSLGGEAKVVGKVMELLHSPDLMQSKPMQELIDDGKIKADGDVKTWLESMEWMKKSDREETARHSMLVDARRKSRASMAASARASVAFTPTERGFKEESERTKETSADDVVLSDGRKSADGSGREEEEQPTQLLAPTVRGKLSTQNESRVLHMLEHELTSWEFDMLELKELTNDHALSAVGWAICERHGIRSFLGITPDTMLRFLRKLEDGYKAVPYHNATHAACVTHGVYSLLTTSPALIELFGSPLDIFTATLAGMMHDLGHTGHNNAFHVATGSELAIRYSDQSVLEMHHLASGFAALNEPGCNCLAHLTDDHRKEVRARVIGMILATDLAVNFPTINTFKQMVSDKAAALAADERKAQGEHLETASVGSSSPSARPSNAFSSPSRLTRASTAGADLSVGHRRRNDSFDKMKLRQLLELRAGSEAEASAKGATGGGGGGNGTADPTSSTAFRRSSGGGGSIRARLLSVAPSEELLILKMVLKVSDIGNVTKGLKVCLGWTERVVQEFFDQGDQEGALGLPVTPFMNRHTACVPKQQLGFYSFVARPMFEALDGLVNLEQQVSNMDRMETHWKSLLPPETES